MDIITGDRRTYQRSASGITVLAHLLGLTALVLMLIWLLHYREGLDLDSENPARVFNVNFLNFHIHFEIILFPVSFFFCWCLGMQVHPFLMYFGFIFFAAEGINSQNAFNVPCNWSSCSNWWNSVQNTPDLSCVMNLKSCLNFFLISNDGVQDCSSGAHSEEIRPHVL